ncbi:hypothetical protein C8R44DRAFT_992515 [Mycena epipterygia]|nr:hypothetical protein C8R44DRAFT_992515 [Mycena epipterygia]
MSPQGHDTDFLRPSSGLLQIPLYLSELTPTQKEFDPYFLRPTEQPPSKPTRDIFRRSRGVLSVFSGWAFLVISAHLLLLAFGWGFYIAVRARGQIALPASTAKRAQENPHTTTILVTLMGTCLSGVSAFLFAHALRRSLALSLSRPMSLAALRATVSISTRTVCFNRQDIKWTMLSLAFFILTGVQTTGWSTLLTPISIVLTTPLVGSELDFTSDVFLQYSQSGIFDDCFQSDLFSQVTIDTAESGLASAQSVVGYPSSLNFNYRTYNVSTGGILPAYLEPVRSTAGRLGNETIPAVTHSVKPLPQQAFVTNYSMVHQGLTADVACQVVPLNTLPMSLNITEVPLINAAGSRTYYSWYAWMDPGCNSRWNDTWQMTDSNNSTIIGLSCHNPRDPFLDAGKRYIFFVSCTVSPKITAVHVDYASSGNIDTTLLSATNSSDLGGPAGMFAFSTIMDMFVVSQGISADTIGNHISSVMRTLPNSQWTDTDLLEEILAAYFRGVVEFSGSLLRTCISETVTPFADGIPANMTRSTEGIYRTETLGWSFTSTPTRVILLPTTLIALSSIAVILFAWIQNPGQMGRRMDFDATNPLHLMAAAAAGGMNDAFKGLGSREIRDGEKMAVEYSRLPLPLPQAELLGLSARSSFHAYLLCLSIPHSVVTLKQLLECLTNLPALEELDISDYQLIANGGADQLLITDVLLT